MGRVNLLFEDGHEGSIIFRADFIGGKSLESPSHKLVGQIIMWLDDRAASKLEPLEETIPVNAPTGDVQRIIRAH